MTNYDHLVYRVIWLFNFIILTTIYAMHENYTLSIKILQTKFLQAFEFLTGIFGASVLTIGQTFSVGKICGTNQNFSNFLTFIFLEVREAICIFVLCLSIS